MSLKNLQKELSHLPYKDMMVLADELAKQLLARREDAACANTVADILSKLNLVPAGLSDDEKMDEKYLREAFNRKRQINVQAQTGGWSIECPTLPGSQVIGTSLRPMFPMMIDQIITMQALTRAGKK
jgi:hypothetical protein